MLEECIASQSEVIRAIAPGCCPCSPVHAAGGWRTHCTQPPWPVGSRTGALKPAQPLKALQPGAVEPSSHGMYLRFVPRLPPRAAMSERQPQEKPEPVGSCWTPRTSVGRG